MSRPPAILFPDGILPVDKAPDWTSHDVCHFLRKRFYIDKVGHAGTLDPMATGLVILLIGRATKYSGALTGHDKTYEGFFRLGLKTDSQDRTGKVLQEADASKITLDDVKLAAQAFTGNIMQTPPMVSAVKHKGVRLYKLARQGKEVEREARPATVHEFNILDKQGDRIQFMMRVSKGTYVRTIAHEIGEKLGCFAALDDLRRTQSGPFQINQSVSLADLKTMTPEVLRGKIIPLESLALLPDSASQQTQAQ